MSSGGARPLVFAHRGACKVAPENTLAAFQAAVELGADGVELDVQYSSDGALVVFHNPTLEATSNGQGRVTSRTLAELRRLDAGSWFGPGFAGERIPTLDETLDLLHGKLLLNIELKALNSATSGLGRDVVAAVRAHGMAGQVILSSFNPFELRRAAAAGPEMANGLLLSPELPGWTRLGVTRAFSLARGLHPELVMVSESYVAFARRLGLPVRVWTANDEPDLRRMVALGVDAIITDRPDLALAIVGSYPAQASTI